MTTRSSRRQPTEDRLEQLLRTGGWDDGDDGVDLDAPLEEQGHVPRDGPEVGGGPPPGELDGRVPRGRHRETGVPVLSVPESLRSAELGVGMRAVRGLLVVVLMVALVLGGRWLWTQRAAEASPADRITTSGPEVSPASGRSEEREESEEAGVAAPDPTTAGQGEGPEVEGAAASPDLVVHVAGEVLEPGVVTVPAGSRVVDAIRASGGLTDAADHTTLNLARPLVDGERVWVGRPGETPPVVAPGPVPSPTAGRGGGGAAGGGSGASGAGAAPLDLNAATQADLEELPGVGPVTAGHILAWREEHGRFSSVDELLEVSGIGERTLAQLAPLVTVGG